MRIKQAYNALLNSKSRGKYDARDHGSDYSYSASGGYQKTQESEEEFYGFGNISYTCLFFSSLYALYKWYIILACNFIMIFFRFSTEKDHLWLNS